MDFFDSQERALRLSRRLLLLFAAAVLGMIAVVYAAVLLLLGFTGGAPGEAALVHPEILAGVALGMTFVIGAGTLIRTAQLKKGGAVVAELLGGRRIRPETDDPDERRLWNVVEEMAIASGIPVPAVFVMDGEPGINAFAAGHTIHDAAVAVTRGALETLTRDELQGVVAHEFSHVLNGDMRLNIRLMGLLFGILLLTVVGRGVVRGTGAGRSRGRGGQIALLGLVLIVLGYLGVLFGRIIQAAVSRQREFLADSAAIQFTRNPDGIAGALKKLGSRGSEITDHHAQEVGHLFFAEGVRGAFSRALSTHPPLEERIRRIDPSWDGRFVRPEPRDRPPEIREAPKAPGARMPGVPGMPIPGIPIPGVTHAGVTHSGTASLPLAAAMMAAAGSPGPEHVAHARELLAGIPRDLRAATRTAEGATAVVLALLLTGPPEVRSRQAKMIASVLAGEAVRRADELREAMTALGPGVRLPLLDLVLPALRELPADEAAAFQALVARLIRADGRIEPFEFALYHVIRRNLRGAGASEPGARRESPPSLPRVRREVETVLSSIARSGSSDEDEGHAAFAAGAALLPGVPGGWTLLPAAAVDLQRVDAALDRLEATPPRVRKAILEAALAIVHADRRVELAEIEMLRAVSEALEVPMPPVLGREVERPGGAGAGGE